MHSAGKLVRIKTALYDTPELQVTGEEAVQELRRAIKTLKEDSKRKLNNDAEVHGAVEQLFRQVDSLRDGLATLSDAMMQEVASRNKHFSQLEDKLQIICDKQVSFIEHIEGQLQQCSNECNRNIEDRSRVLQADVRELACSTDNKFEDLRDRIREDLTELSEKCSDLNEAVEHSQKSVSAHANKMELKVDDLMNSHEQMCKNQHTQNAQLARMARMAEQDRCDVSETLDNLREEFVLRSRASDTGGRVSETEVKGALQAITTQMQAQQDVCTERIEEMQRRLQRQEQETKVNLSASSTEYADVIKRLQDTIDEERVQAKAAKDSFQKQLRDAATNAETALDLAKSDMQRRMAALEDETRENKANRDTDLQIIEKALTIAHSNQEKSDKVLQETINALKQLEKRCATSAQQGDMLAGAVEEVQHRMGTMQRALVPPDAQASARAAYEESIDVL